MATKPDVMPAWATDDNEAELEQPASGLVTRGFRTGEPADPGIWNWLKKKVCEWLDYFEQTTDELDTKIDDEIDGVNTTIDDHEHDGTPIAKVNFSDHLDYGENGLMKVTSDDLVGHTIRYESVDGSVPIIFSVEGRVEAEGSLWGQYVHITQEVAPSTPWDTLGQVNLIKAFADVDFIYDASEPNDWRAEFNASLGIDEASSGATASGVTFTLLGTVGGSEFWEPTFSLCNASTLQDYEVIWKGGQVGGGTATNPHIIAGTPRIFDEMAGTWDNYIPNGTSGRFFNVRLIVL